MFPSLPFSLSKAKEENLLIHSIFRFFSFCVCKIQVWRVLALIKNTVYDASVVSFTDR